MSKILTAVLARLEEAMEAYKPRMAKRRIKTDPEHRTQRQEYKRRNTTEKKTEQRKDKAYYKRNRNQLLQRNKRSRMLHKRVATATVVTKPNSPILSSVLSRISVWA